MMDINETQYTMEGHPVTIIDVILGDPYPYVAEIDRFGEIETAQYSATGSYIIGKKSLQDLDLS